MLMGSSAILVTGHPSFSICDIEIGLEPEGILVARIGHLLEQPDRDLGER
jgi:hypothetical protein